MKILLAGGSGVVGRKLIPMLVEKGHDVVAAIRSRDKVGLVEALGGKAMIVDALDAKAFGDAIEMADPDVLIHQLTAHGGLADFKKLDDDFAVTNRLRTEALDTMLEAARRVGVRRVIAQSFCGWPYAREGGLVKNEDDPLDPTPPASFRETLGAIRYLEETLQSRRPHGTDGIILRYGFLYGPGTGIAKDGELSEMIRKRGFPVVGGGAGVWSFTHVDDAAAAAVAAVSHGESGVYNIVDDDPAPVATWLPFLAHSIGAKPPRRVPAWMARPVIGEGGVMMMTQVRGGDNAKAKSSLGWRPKYSSWRKGFVEGLG